MLTAFAACVIWSVASGQRTNDALEELTVRGRTPQDLRLEIVRAENRMFEIFNSINSTDDFDIHCQLETRAGTNIETRVCLPNFAREARAVAGQAFLANTGAGIAQNRDTQTAIVVSGHRQEDIAAEMRRLAAENEELRRAMIELYELNAELDPERFESIEAAGTADDD